MRKFLFLLLIFVIGFMLNYKNYGTYSKETIPNEAIRLRIVANSNSTVDQSVKLVLKDRVNEYIYRKLDGINNYQRAREIVYDSKEELGTIVDDTLSDFGIENTYYVDYGITYFPAKAYGDYVYPAGNYEALYIEIGEGLGDNWWCVLFPPLCLVDVGVTDNGSNEVEYRFLIFDYIKKLFMKGED